jgi:hypothetical protein
VNTTDSVLSSLAAVLLLGCGKSDAPASTGVQTSPSATDAPAAAEEPDAIVDQAPPEGVPSFVILPAEIEAWTQAGGKGLPLKLIGTREGIQFLVFEQVSGHGEWLELTSTNDYF